MNAMVPWWAPGCFLLKAACHYRQDSNAPPFCGVRQGVSPPSSGSHRPLLLTSSLQPTFRKLLIRSRTRVFCWTFYFLSLQANLSSANHQSSWVHLLFFTEWHLRTFCKSLVYICTLYRWTLGSSPLPPPERTHTHLLWPTADCLC